MCVCFLQSLPSFGPYLKERESIVAKHKEKIDLLSEQFEPEKVRPAYKPDKAAPLIKVIQSNVGIVAHAREINGTEGRVECACPPLSRVLYNLHLTFLMCLPHRLK